MSTLEALWFKNKKLPSKVNSIEPKVLNAINKIMLQTPQPSKSAQKRGYYSAQKLSNTNKYIVARYASYNGISKAVNYIKFAEFNLKEATVRGWKNKFEKAKKSLGRDPRTANEAGLISKSRGRKSQLGADNKYKICEYIKFLRKSGADINRYTTAAAIKAYLVSTKQSYMLKENGGWIDIMNISLIRELWKKCGYTKRKKCRKRRGKIGKNKGFIAAQYKLRCALVKKKYDIPDCLDFNFDETKLPIVPVSAYSMDEKGKKDIEGEKLDDKRCVTGFCGGARTGEAAKLQYINKGKTTKCHPTLPAPDNIFYDHTASKNSTPDSTIRFAKKGVVEFKNSQIAKYNLTVDRHALCRWDIFYTHITEDVIKYLLENNVHVVIVPPNMTDDLQQMDKGVNASFKYMLRRRFVDWRATQSINQLNDGITAEDVFVKYGLKALKNIHVGWTASAWTYVEEQGLIKKSFDMVDDNLVGYTRWDDKWIANEFKNNNFVRADD